MRDTRLASNLATIFTAILCAIATGFAALLEIGGALCLSGGVFAAYGAMWTLLLVPLLFTRPSIAKFAIYAVFLVSLVALFVVPWNSRKTFLRDFDDVRIGMTKDEVDAIMGKYIKGTGWPAEPDSDAASNTLIEVGTGIELTTSASPAGELEIEGSVVYRHSNKSAFNSDWGVVKFQHGRVIMKTFMPD